MKTVTSTSLRLFISILAIASASYAQEPTKMQKDANATKLEGGSPVEGFSLSIRVTQRILVQKRRKCIISFLGKPYTS